jgi:hypothetical protein
VRPTAGRVALDTLVGSCADSLQHTRHGGVRRRLLLAGNHPAPATHRYLAAEDTESEAKCGGQPDPHRPARRGVLFGLGASVYDWNDPFGRLFLQTLAMVAEFEANLNHLSAQLFITGDISRVGALIDVLRCFWTRRCGPGPVQPSAGAR